MSLVDRSLSTGEAGHPVDMSNTQTFDDKSDFALSSQPATFDEPIFDKFDDMDGHDTMAPNPKRVRTGAGVPELPQRSALRASRLLDNHGFKLGGAGDAAGLAQATTPHDVYLSSEEDASSDADDFSDYDYESSVENLTSPIRRNSHEDTARVVSVVFAGKPSLVDLPASRRRPASSSSMATTATRSSIYSTASTKPPAMKVTTTEDRPATSASTTSSKSQRRLSNGPTTLRRSILLSDLLTKKKPLFLSIDPYANGTTYALGVPKALDSLEGESPARTPRTPTQVFKGMTRSFSLSRKRSRAAMRAAPSPQTPIPSPATAVPADQHEQPAAKDEGEPQQSPQQQHPHTPITYTDIIRAVKRNATVVGAPLPQSDLMSPTSPASGQPTVRRGILSGLAARRKSMRLTGRP
ncbi:hypothetical protein BT67DRAFT_116336 [Trichocladium antarcticum]|uniref:Uncharacterized protein n=1 Tax=Trichocladium antarcticum TaxID=1450529 RepID=A0AAN6UTK8_9PEZI|nr:hypothetical protein BT67DRAFT_116336 [Trichocladium antarcticum]